MSSKKVAIIGAGASGLTSAKYALENGLEPVVFEMTDRIGGLWAGNGSAIWDGLLTNISIYTMMISDHPWPKDCDIFQESKGVYTYLIGYAKRFGLEEHINYCTKVEHAKKLIVNGNTKWEITSLNTKTSEKNVQVFDFLMVSSGLHSKPKIPIIEDSSVFNGVQIHSSKFKLNDPQYKSKKVITLGCSVSGAEISERLVGQAESVTNIFSRPYLITPRLIKYKLITDTGKNLYSILPIDLFFNRRSLTYPNPKLTPDENKEEMKQILTRVFPYQTNQQLSHPALYFDIETYRTVPLLSISDFYIEYVKENKIKPIRSKIKKFAKNGVWLENGSFLEADVVIYCTGFESGNSFFDKSVMDTIKYSTNYSNFSILLYNSTFHPDLENLAIIGHAYGFFFAGCELQSKWATMVFSDKIKLPSKEFMRDEIEKDEIRREKNRTLQYPYGTHVEIIDRLGNEMDLLPNLEDLKTSDPNLFDLFWNSSALSSNFIYKQNKSLATEIMTRVHEMNNMMYEFECEEDEISVSLVAEKFSKYYKIPKGLYSKTV